MVTCVIKEQGFSISCCFFLITLLAVPVYGQMKCQEGNLFSRWDGDGMCYRYFSDIDPVQFVDAKAECGKYGGYPTSVKSQAQEDFLVNDLLAGEPGSFWIGLYKDSKDDWFWYEDDSPKGTYGDEPNQKTFVYAMVTVSTSGSSWTYKNENANVPASIVCVSEPTCPLSSTDAACVAPPTSSTSTTPSSTTSSTSTTPSLTTSSTSTTPSLTTSSTSTTPSSTTSSTSTTPSSTTSLSMTTTSPITVTATTTLATSAVDTTTISTAPSSSATTLASTEMGTTSTATTIIAEAQSSTTTTAGNLQIDSSATTGAPSTTTSTTSQTADQTSTSSGSVSTTSTTSATAIKEMEKTTVKEETTSTLDVIPYITAGVLAVLAVLLIGCLIFCLRSRKKQREKEEEKAMEETLRQEKESQEEKIVQKPRVTYGQKAVLSLNLITATGDTVRSLTPTDIDPWLSSPESSPPSTSNSSQQIMVKPAFQYDPSTEPVATAGSDMSKLVLAMRAVQAFSKPKKKIKLLPSLTGSSTPTKPFTSQMDNYSQDDYEPPITADNKFKRAAAGISKALSFKPRRLQLLPASRPAKQGNIN